MLVLEISFCKKEEERKLRTLCTGRKIFHYLLRVTRQS